MLALFGVPAAMLPEVRSSSEVYGTTTGFGHPIPIAGIAGDQQAALFGQVCTKAGMAKNTYGTGCFMLMNTGDKPVVSKHRLLTTIGLRIGDRTEYALGSIFIAGAVVQWLRDGLGIIKHASDIEALAASVPDTGGVSLVPAFAGLGAPHWDGHTHGTITGITRHTTAAHFTRAALESIALQTVDVLGAMQADSGIRLKEICVDGGATANDLLMQMQADFAGVPVVRPQVTEIASLWQAEARFKPAMKPAARRAKFEAWETAVRQSKARG